jgi:transposase-like protein
MSMLDLGDARRLTERIRLMAMTVGDNIDKLKGLVSEARESEVHVALGYASWTAYLADVLGETPMRLERDVRQELVAELSAQGMSTRAIAPIVGATKSQVARDIAEVSQMGQVPEVEPDSYWSPETAFVGAHPITGEILDAPTTITETHTIKTVTGLDGKTYKTPEPRAPKPVATGDAANQINAEGMSKEIGHALDILSLFENASHRARVLTDWWPLGNGAVPPISRALFNPAQLRQIAASLGQLAIEMESTNV